MPEQPTDKPETTEDATVVREDGATVVRSESADTATADDATVVLHADDPDATVILNPDDPDATALYRADPAKTTVYREEDRSADNDATKVVNADAGQVTRSRVTRTIAGIGEDNIRQDQTTGNSKCIAL